MNIGCIVRLERNPDIEKEMKNLAGLGLHSCQVVSWDRKFFNTEKNAKRVKDAAESLGITITAFWCGWEGPAFWNFTEGPITLGLVPEAYRMERLQTLKEGSYFAKDLGVSDLITHVGFLPENRHDPLYAGTLAALKDLMKVCEANRQYFLFETGQETPVTLMRMMKDIGSDYLGINLDPANLLLYGKANPVDAVDIFGKKIRGVHGKDGLYPTCPGELGRETKIGDGRVDYPVFLKKLFQLGYQGDITIEREISGEEQIRDILFAKQYLSDLIGKLE